MAVSQLWVPVMPPASVQKSRVFSHRRAVNCFWAAHQPLSPRTARWAKKICHKWHLEVAWVGHRHKEMWWPGIRTWIMARTGEIEPCFKWNRASKPSKELKLFLDLVIVLVHNLSFCALFFLSQLPHSSVVSHLEYVQHHYCSFTLDIVSISFRWTYRERIITVFNIGSGLQLTITWQTREGYFNEHIILK